MSFAFAVAKDAVRTTVANYVLGSGSLTVAAGTGALFPVPSAGAPILFTVATAASYATYPETYATYKATGITNDTLTGLTVVSGVDTAWAVGAIVEMRTCAKHLNDLAAQAGAGGGSGVINSGSTNQLGYFASPGTTLSPLNLGTNLSITGGALNAAGGGGGAGTVGSGTAGQPAMYSAAGTAVAGSSKGLIINQHMTAAVVPTGTSGTVSIDLSASDLFGPVAMTGNVTLALVNLPTGGLTQTFRVLLKQAASGGPFSLTYPGGVVWVGSSAAPDMTAIAAGETLELVFTYLSSGVILGHFPGATNTDPPGGGGGGGSGSITEVSETGNFTAAAGGAYVISGSAAVAATLPTAAGVAGQTVRIRCASGYTGLCTITGTGGQTIGGQAGRIIYAGESPVLESDGTNWVRTGGTVIPCSCTMYLGTVQSIPSDGAQHLVLLDTATPGSMPGMVDLGSNSVILIRPGHYRVTTMVSSTVTAANSLVVWAQASSPGLFGNGMRTSEETFASSFGLSMSVTQTLSGGSAGDLITLKIYQNNVAGSVLNFDAGNNYLIVEEILAW